MSINFKAELRKKEGRLGWTVVTVPFSVKEKFGSGGIVRARGTINGFEFRSTLFPAGDGQHVLLVNKQIQKQARIRPGQMVAVKIEKDADSPPIKVPEILEKELSRSAGARKSFMSFTESDRRYFAKLILARKSTEAKKRTAQRIAEQMLELHEAVLDTPPALKRELAQVRGAEKRFSELSSSRKRHYLYYVIAARTPEARQRRAEKIANELAANP